jgi:hypothetical protein
MKPVRQSNAAIAAGHHEEFQVRSIDQRFLTSAKCCAVFTTNHRALSAQRNEKIRNGVRETYRDKD